MAKSEKQPLVGAEQLKLLGFVIRNRRKQLKVSATVAAESAGLSRVTWHRIEKGEPSVSAGAYFSALAVLDLSLPLADLVSEQSDEKPKALPLKINLNEYPQLKLLAWQLQGTNELSCKEAWGIYQRNWRHVEATKLKPNERDLISMLQEVFEGREDVLS